MGEYKSSFTGTRIDQLLGMVDQNAFASADHTHESENVIMWEGASYMNATHVYELAQKVSDQPHGIVLVFSCFDKDAGTSQDNGWSTHFIPKSLSANAGFHTFLMACRHDDGSVSFGAKQLYISNTEIGGHEWNDVNTTSGTESNNSNIAFRNGNYVLRYVIGV